MDRIFQCGGLVMKYLNSLVILIPLVFGIVDSKLSEANHQGIYYDNFNYTDNVIFKGSTGQNIDYTAQLTNVGDYYEISFDVINDSSVDVKISNCVYHQDDPYINYQLTYEDGKSINEGDILKQGESKTVKYRVLYKNQIVEDSYQFDTSFSIGYEQVL